MLPNQLSPGVNYSEIDQTTRVPGFDATKGAFVGNFRWGPVEEPSVVTIEEELVARHGAPTPINSVDFHIAAQFLAYTRNLDVIRAVTSSALNANAGGDGGTLIKNRADYDGQDFIFGTHGNWVARYPGALGNSLAVSIQGFTTDESTTAAAFASWAYSGLFDSAPGTSPYAARFSSENDEVHVVVVDEDGLFTGTPGRVLEVFPFLSLAADAKTAQGASNYYKDVINARSKYIFFGAADTTSFPNSGALATAGRDFAASVVNGRTTVSLTAGADSGALTNSEYSACYALFDTEVSLIIGPDYTTSNATTIGNGLISEADGRMNAVVTLSAPNDATDVEDIVAWANDLNSSSYAVFDSGRLVVYDKYNDALINIPASGSVAGVIAETDRQFGAWVSPGGVRKGQIRNVTKVAINPATKAQRDALYKARVNPIVTFPGEGTMLYGDKTALARPSAFDRINVRRLFILLERTISQAAKDVLFENNTEFTRANFVGVVEPVLRNIQGRGGIIEFGVVCDETNNGPEVQANKQFVADIYIAPAYSINFVQLNFVATREGTAFTTSGV